ncbi:MULTISPECIES: NUDIX hydrolase [Nocardiopsis]|uniref:NUDIX hydrolase n=1 Tax=Nocardiopsis TaxID=2013 RepID=UPI000988E9E5|nr:MULTISPECIES: NUDIX hydrolase [Nocardiopsis]
MSTKTAKRCCGTSVGILIEDQADRLLMVTRGWWPKGTAPVAGHVRDAHTSVAEALVAEVQEETGLHVTGSGLLWEGHLPNLCASLPALPDPGHYWWVAAATAEGTLTPAPGETKGAAWYTRRQVRTMARTTLAHYRNGGLPADQPDARGCTGPQLHRDCGPVQFSRVALSLGELVAGGEPAVVRAGR